MIDFPDIVPEIKEFFKKLIGPSTEELGLWGGEKIRFLRFKSSIKTFTRAQEFLEKAGFSEPKPVELKTLLPLIEFCSLENDDSDLIDKWAGLLATASSFGLINYTYPHILNQLSSIEVKILDILYDNYGDERKELIIRWVSRDAICNKLNITGDDIIIYLGNLFRLGLCRSSFATVIDRISSETDIFYENCTLTPLGVDFIKACKGPRNII